MITNKNGDHIGGTIALDKKDFKYNESTKTVNIIPNLYMQYFNKDDDGNLIQALVDTHGMTANEEISNLKFKLPTPKSNYRIRLIGFSVFNPLLETPLINARSYSNQFVILNKIATDDVYMQGQSFDIDKTLATRLDYKNVFLRIIAGYNKVDSYIEVILNIKRVQTNPDPWEPIRYQLEGYYLLQKIED